MEMGNNQPQRIPGRAPSGVSLFQRDAAMTLLEAALAYAVRGLYVFPVHGITAAGLCDCDAQKCESPGKHPLTKKGCKDATTEAARLKEWWGRWPNANVAILTGTPSGIIVLDVDGPEGESFLKDKSVPPTPAAKTGRGRHIFFKHPGGAVRNAVKIAPALDVRGDGGYVVAAPSKHKSGAVYTWFEALSFEEMPLADAPSWLLDLMQPKPKTKRRADAGQDAGPDEIIPEGERNDKFYRLACSLRSKGLGQEAILGVLRAENARLCRPPLTEPEIRKITGRAATHKPGKTRDNGQAPPCAQRLVEIGQKAQLFSDERGDAYAQVKEPGRLKILRVHSSTFRRWLSGCYYKAHQGVASAEALRGAVEVLEHQAVHDGERFDLHNRFCRKDGVVWLDLCDEGGRAVRITADGWDIVDKPPILFRRFPHQAALPEPVKGGVLRDFLPQINVARPEDGILILAWLVAVPLADIPRPILCLHGPQGSAKTTAARMLRALLDPSAVESTALRRDEAELAQILDHHAVPLFDNLSGIGPAQSDLLCGAVTGGGFSKRVLFTDDDDALRAFKRAILLTAINVPTILTSQVIGPPPVPPIGTPGSGPRSV